MDEDRIAEAVYQKLKANAFSNLATKDDLSEIEGKLWPILEDLNDKAQSNAEQIERISNALDDRGWV